MEATMFDQLVKRRTRVTVLYRPDGTGATRGFLLRECSTGVQVYSPEERLEVFIPYASIRAIEWQRDDEE